MTVVYATIIVLGLKFISQLFGITSMMTYMGTRKNITNEDRALMATMPLTIQIIDQELSDYRDSHCVKLVNEYLGYSDVLVSKVPTILYVNEDNIIRIENIITRDDDELITSGDFQKLLDIQ